MATGKERVIRGMSSRWVFGLGGAAALLLAVSGCGAQTADWQDGGAAATGDDSAHAAPSRGRQAAPTKTAKGVPAPGLHAYTMGHAMTQNPPERVGGALRVEVTQRNGSTRFVLPGPRFLDPSVFGSPDNPVGFDPAPFPLLGIDTKLRRVRNGKYTFVDHATPFSDWREVGVGSMKLVVVDRTAIDGARTKDTISFDATFKAPDGVEYRVTCDRALPHGMAFPFFGGVVTNHLLHGGTGIGTRLMPTEFTYAAFWGIGKIYKEGKLINDMHMVHGMVTEIVRKAPYKLQFDGGVGSRPGITFHLMVPPYRPVPGKGMVKAPLRTGFIPFPFVKKHMMAAKKMLMAMPDGPKKKEKMAVMMEIKALMKHTKEHVMHAMQEGKMDGQPFFHVMFGNIEMTASHE